MKKLIVYALVIFVFHDNQFAQSTKIVEYNSNSKSIVLLEGKGENIISDGIFSEGEWDGATTFKIAENYDIYLLTNSENLFLGLKSSKQTGAIGIDIWMTTNGKEIYRLHVSMKLGEGFTTFENYDRRDYMRKNKDWEANFIKEENAAAVELKDGIEFKIKRNKFSTNRLKMRMEWRNLDEKMSNQYPSDSNLKNADNWVELILSTSNE